VNRITSFLKGNIRQYAMFIALLFIVVMFQILTKGILLVPQNVTNLIQQNSYILILAMGMLICIVSGAFDLSVGSVAACVGAISAVFLIKLQINTFVGILIAILAGVIIGAMQGYFISYVRVPAFIVTLSGMLVFRGLTQVILAGRTLAPFPKGFKVVSTGFLPDIFNGSDLHLTTILIGIVGGIVLILIQSAKRRKKSRMGIDVISLPVFILQVASTFLVINVFTYWLALYRGLPTVLILLFALYLFYDFMTKKTVIGRHIYAMGGNEKAARLSGVSTQFMLFLAFVNMGFLSAVAGFIFTGRLDAATPKAGTGFELDAIAACYIGGASSSGGVGTIIGVIIGGLVMGVLNNGMSIMGVNVDWQLAIKGIVLLSAVVFDVKSKSNSN
jgi:putative multiple sugar transport system permease protein